MKGGAGEGLISSKNTSVRGGGRGGFIVQRGVWEVGLFVLFGGEGWGKRVECGWPKG